MTLKNAMLSGHNDWAKPSWGDTTRMSRFRCIGSIQLLNNIKNI
jgi:hypothetical protein